MQADTDVTIAARVRSRVADVPAPLWALAGLIGAFIVVFGRLTAAQHANFGTFGFDMGIYDQGIWLLSRFREPFVTVRGLNLFANHVDPIYVLFIPAYWLGAGPIFLSVTQTAWIAAGAIPVYGIPRDRIGHAWLAVALGGAYLLHPSLEWINWFHFHPEALAATPLLFAWWMAERGRWRWFAVAVVLAVLCKESVTMATFVLGLIVAWRHDRRIGLATSALSMIWFLVTTRVIIPAANDGIGPFYDEFYGQWGSSAADIAANIVRHPGMFFDTMTESGRMSYYRQMLAPVGFTALGAPVALAIGAPQVIVNALSSHSLTHNIRYQYSTVVVAAIFLATIEMIRRVRPLGGRRFFVGAVVACSLAANVAWSPSPIGVKFQTGIWARHAQPRHAVVSEALRLIPGDAGVSATYYLVPQLTHRVHVYEWPNPFENAYWGVAGENPHPVSRAQYLAIDRRLLGEKVALFDQVISDYEVLFDTDDIVVARRR